VPNKGPINEPVDEPVGENVHGGLEEIVGRLQFRVDRLEQVVLQ
jgi:hypothetical protein